MAERIMAMLAVTEGTLYSMKTAKSTGPQGPQKSGFPGPCRPIPMIPWLICNLKIWHLPPEHLRYIIPCSAWWILRSAKARAKDSALG
jgi:hypothetical protein